MIDCIAIQGFLFRKCWLATCTSNKILFVGIISLGLGCCDRRDVVVVVLTICLGYIIRIDEEPIRKDEVENILDFDGLLCPFDALTLGHGGWWRIFHPRNQLPLSGRTAVSTTYYGELHKNTI